MQSEYLQKMANQIASFYATQPDIDKACLDFCMHLRKFWTQETRTEFLLRLDRGDYCDKIHGFPLEAIKRYRTKII